VPRTGSDSDPSWGYASAQLLALTSGTVSVRWAATWAAPWAVTASSLVCTTDGNQKWAEVMGKKEGKAWKRNEWHTQGQRGDKPHRRQKNKVQRTLDVGCPVGLFSSVYVVDVP
jgi:hypothetical protein